MQEQNSCVVLGTDIQARTHALQQAPCDTLQALQQSATLHQPTVSEELTLISWKKQSTPHQSRINSDETLCRSKGLKATSAYWIIQLPATPTNLAPYGSNGTLSRQSEQTQIATINQLTSYMVFQLTYKIHPKNKQRKARKGRGT